MVWGAADGFSGDPPASATLGSSPDPPGLLRGVQGYSTPRLGPVDVVESGWDRYEIAFANGRTETTSGCGARGVDRATPPYQPGERVFVRFSDGIDYVGTITSVDPARHLVRARDGREEWVYENQLTVSFVRNH